MPSDEPVAMERGAGSTQRRPAAVAAAGLAATTGFLLAPSGSVLQGVLWAVPFVLAATLLTRRALAAPAETRTPLRLLLAGVLVYVLALVPWYVGPAHAGWVLPFPSLVDVGFFTAYALYAGFLLVLLRNRAADSRLESRLAATDAAIVALAMSAVLWVTVIEAQLQMHLPALTTSTVLLYPAFQLVLLTLAVRLSARTGGRRRAPLALVLAWIGAELLGDVAYGVQSVDGTFRYDGALMLTWMVAYTALATFAAHPAAAAVLQPAPTPSGELPPAARTPLRRPVGTGMRLAAASVPLALAVRRGDLDPALLAVAVLIFGLVLLRASLLSSGLAEQRRLAADLEGALAQLRTQHDELVLLGAAVDASQDAVATCSPQRVVLSWSRGAERLTGRPREEVVGRHLGAFVAPGEQQEAEALLSAVEQERHVRVERAFTRRDGVTVEVEAAVSSIRDEGDDLLGFVAVVREVTERNVLHRELAEQARRLADAQRVAQVGSWEWDLATDAVVWSAELYRIFALDPATTITPTVYLEHVHPADRERVAREIARLDGGMDVESRIVGGDGEVRWVAVRGGVLTDAEGVPVRKTGTVQDITERVVLEHELAAQVRRLDEAQRLAGVGSFDFDLVTGDAVWSPELYRIVGVEQGVPASHARYLDRLHPDDRDRVQHLIVASEEEESFDYETRVVRPDGQVRWLGVHGEVVHDGEGRPVRRRGTAADITERKLAESELERLASTDTLTGLANRHGFTALLQSALAGVDGERVVGLMLLDLDGFKDVNDGLGHHAGDLVLQEVARRARAVLRGGDEVSRLGGDEFAVVLPDLGTPDRAIEVAASLRACLEDPFDLDGVTVHVGGSIGIALTDRPIDPSELLKQADIAMYRAKKLPSGWAVFEAGQDDVAAGRLQMVTDLRAAIESGELDVAYQPIVATRSRQVTSFEALARWQHPERGAVPPDQFIPLAEQADLIVPLTRLVLRKAVSACAAWQRAGRDLRVGVNLSVQVMESADTRCMVAEALEEAGLEAQHLILEITESSLAHDAETINAALHGLRDLGVTLVIDDFGTGYSAMSYLKQLPVEELKIDRSFVRDIATDGRDSVIVRSLVRLAHSLGLRVVAEGVESVPVLDVLAGLGCDFAQGYGIARPMAEQHTAGWLAGYDARTSAGVDRRTPTDLLVVDDSATVRTSLAVRAEREGWLVREAASAEEALLEVERAVPDVVILDHHMSGMTGTDAVPELRTRGVNGPILLFTQFLSDAMPSLRVPLDVWPVSKGNADGVFGLLDGYRISVAEGVHASQR